MCEIFRNPLPNWMSKKCIICNNFWNHCFQTKEARTKEALGTPCDPDNRKDPRNRVLGWKKEKPLQGVRVPVERRSKMPDDVEDWEEATQGFEELRVCSLVV